MINLNPSNLKHEVIDFNNIDESSFLKTLDFEIEKFEKNFQALLEQDQVTYDNTIFKLEQISERIDRLSLLFSNLHSAHCTDSIEKDSVAFFEKITKWGSSISLNEAYFKRMETLWNSKNEYSYTDEQLVVLEKEYKRFVRNGANLESKNKEIIKDIDEKLSALSVKFSENSRKSSNAFELHILDEEKLAGLSNEVISAAKDKAQKQNKAGYSFGLDYPTYAAIMKTCSNRNIREEVYKAKMSVANTGEFDNTDLIKEFLKLREKRSEILGYKNHAHFTLERRMANTQETVFNFLDDLYKKAFPKAKEEFLKLEKIFKENFPEEDIRKWDQSFYTEILQQRELQFNDSVLKPYFKMENVLEGLFTVAKNMFDLDIKPIDIPVYHKEVMSYELTRSGEYVGVLYMDLYPRKEKRQGAWMTEFQSQGTWGDENKRAHVSLVCNFTKPSGDTPSLLTLGEVLTLYHEFGHGLHGLLSDVTYRSVAGPNVFWDFVELPSQILENWVYEPECLKLFAKHYQTNVVLPKDLIDKVKKVNQFMQGTATLRQLNFATLDMKYHTHRASDIENIDEFEKSIAKDHDLFPLLEDGCFSHSFGHIFAGGYSAGYYSYKWAEVLDADAFNIFKKEGIFNKETAKRFERSILSKGGSEHPMTLYKNFAGKEPSTSALIERAGLN